MKLETIRLSGFQSFGQEPTELNLEEITYLIGPNGSGKTATLQALCRLFAFNPALRRIQRSDFHVPFNEGDVPDERQLWIEADFSFPELAEDEDNSTVAPHFGHMRLDEVDGVPRVRFRLTATMGPDGDIEENLVYVPTSMLTVILKTRRKSQEQIATIFRSTICLPDVIRLTI